MGVELLNKIEILFEDDSTLVVHKPSGLLVHPDGSSDDPTLIDWILERFPEMYDVGEEQRLKDGSLVKRPGVVHRLDRDTSGCLLLAKTSEAHAWYKSQFQNRTIHKTYLAFVHGGFKEKEGVIDRPIGKSRSDFRRWSAERGARGVLRDARTRYRVLSTQCAVSLVKAFPETGRTHQIRVHFKAIGHPLVHDSLYGPHHTKTHPELLGFTRLALHARSIEFVTLKAEEKKVEAPLPADFQEALQMFDDPSLNVLTIDRH